MTRLAFELSGENLSIPRSEVLSLFHGDVVQEMDRVIVLDTRRYDHKLGERLAMSHAIIRVRDICEQNLAAIYRAARHMELPDVSVAVRAKRIGPGLPSVDVEAVIGKALHERGYRIDLTKPELTVKALLSGGSCVLGTVLLNISRSHFELRSPRMRPFFYPGVLLPRMARAVVNLAGAQPHELLLDPFCGTGGILLEAGLVGMTCVGSDADSRMVCGAKLNLEHYGVASELSVQDAQHLAFRDKSINAIVTDLPYGRSVSIYARSARQLREETFEEMARVLKPKGRVVVLAHVKVADELEQADFYVEACHNHYVHKSLTREITVVRK